MPIDVDAGDHERDDGMRPFAPCSDHGRPAAPRLVDC